MTGDAPSFLVVGHVSKPHGMRGELFVEALTDHPGDVFVPGVVLRPGGAHAPDPDLPPLRVEDARPFKKGVLVSFGGVLHRDDGDRLRGLYLWAERALLPELAEGEVFFHQLVGMEVFGADGARIGVVIEIYELDHADLLEIRTEKGTVIVPFLDSLVREMDVPGRRLVIDPPAGLLDT